LQIVPFLPTQGKSSPLYSTPHTPKGTGDTTTISVEVAESGHGLEGNRNITNQPSQSLELSIKSTRI